MTYWRILLSAYYTKRHWIFWRKTKKIGVSLVLYDDGIVRVERFTGHLLDSIKVNAEKYSADEY